MGASNAASLTKDAIYFTAGTEALGLQSVQIDFIAGTEVLDLQKVVLIAVSEELDLQWGYLYSGYCAEDYLVAG